MDGAEHPDASSVSSFPQNAFLSFLTPLHPNSFIHCQSNSLARILTIHYISSSPPKYNRQIELHNTTLLYRFNNKYVWVLLERCDTMSYAFSCDNAPTQKYLFFCRLTNCKGGELKTAGSSQKVLIIIIIIIILAWA